MIECFGKMKKRSEGVDMKKRLLFGCAVLCAAVLAGCGKSEVKTDELSGYVQLGSIRDLGVVYEKTEVSEEDIEDAIREDLESMADYDDKKAPIEMGDTIQIRVMATGEDGEEIYDFADEPYEMTVGEAEWGEEFDELLVGKSAGDSGQVTYDYDADFEDMELAGHKVTLDYNIDMVCIVNLPELDEAFFKEMGYDDEESYRESIKKTLEEDNEYTDKQDYVQALLDVIKANSVFSDIPSSVLDYAKECVEGGYEGYADLVDCELEEVYDMLGVTKEDIEEEALDYAKDMIVLDAVRDSEGIELDSKTYDKMLSDFMAEEEYESMTEVYEYYDKSELEEMFIDELVKDYLVSINS